MPSIHIHLAIAERYVEKHKINDKNEFIDGSIAPDFIKPKSLSHYATIRKEKVSIMQELSDRASLKNYLKENNIKSDFDRGYALHLLADEFFSRSFLMKNILKNIPKKNFRQICIKVMIF